jgi:transcriptional regulator with XRE-family HTH domain
MNDNLQTIGQQIRQLRGRKGWTLAELASRAGTSAPTVHRYENGWYRFELETLRRIAAALDARLEVRLVAGEPRPAAVDRPAPAALVKTLAPLFWDRPLRESDLADHAGWVLERVLTAGNCRQVRLSRAYFGDRAVGRAARRRGVDRRTREYWRVILGERGDASASQGP